VNFLSLYSGVGMHDLGFTLAGINIVGQVEWDDYCAAVLEKHWPGLPRWKDVRDVSVDAVRERCGHIDGITGGFSCRNISVAGRGEGISKTTESGITWRNMFRLIRGLRPDWLIIENVPRLRTLAGDRVLGALERIGYACWPLVVGAIHVGASFVGQRVWIVAASGSARLQTGRQVSSGAEPVFAMSAGGCLHRGVAGPRERQHEWEEPRLVERPMGMPVDGTSARLVQFASERSIHAVGNGNPPALAEAIGRAVIHAAAKRGRA
jgi:DNA (cytosine-5)-methyltransferase 1